MSGRLHLVALAAFVVAGCTKTVVLEEPNPLLVSAAAPEEPPPPPPPPPERVEVKKEKIQVNETIHFEWNKAVIRPESFDLLDEIAGVINEHPEILKIRIEGHTDSTGNAEYNMKLSKQRAKAVHAYLVDKGSVDAGRLSTEGYGMEKPIADNETDEGRAQNRRVEFTILERAEEGEAADGEGAEDGAAADEGAADEGAADEGAEDEGAADDADDESAEDEGGMP